MMGGSIGAILRYGIALSAVKIMGSRFPWGTLIANLIGCFLIGATFALVDRTNFLSPSARLFFMTGFLGALTTFSTYALETINFARSGIFSAAALNIFVNNIGGVTCALGGIWLVQFIIKGD